MRMKVVGVEGLIGGGKSTLSKELGAALCRIEGAENSMVLMEPDEKGNANPYLTDYYGHEDRWSFTMQAHLLALRFRMHQNAQWHALEGRGHAVLDRTFYGDTAFARLQVRRGFMSDREFSTYSRLYQGMTASVMLPTVCIRVLVSPETCNVRLKKRMEIETGRQCEAGIDIGYLRGLDQEIDHMVGVLRGQGVTILDMPWDDERGTEDDRRQVVDSLAARIVNLEPRDDFLDMHRRAI